MATNESTSGKGPDTPASLSLEHSELIAAYLDGSVTEEERTQVLDLLATSPAARSALLDAQAIAEESADRSPRVLPGDSGAAAEAGPPTRFRFRRRWGWIPVAAAAGLAIALVSRGAQSEFAESRLVPLVAGSLAESVGVQWSDVGWDAIRGPTASLSPSQRGFRVGARLTDFYVAWGAGDGQSLSLVGGELITLIGDTPGGAPEAVAQLRAALAEAGWSPDNPPASVLPGAARTMRRTLGDVESTTRRALGNPATLDLGRALERSRLAVGLPGVTDSIVRDYLDDLIALARALPNSPISSQVAALEATDPSDRSALVALLEGIAEDMG